MANPYTGDVPLEIGGVQLTLVYDWRALGRMRAELGKDGQAAALSGELKSLAVLVEIGLHRHHGDWNAARVTEASPPVMVTIDAVEKALSYAYFGPKGAAEEEPGENPQKPSSKPTLLSRLWRRLIGSE